MKPILTKAVYERIDTRGPFDLRNNQMSRKIEVVLRNAGWYNQKGERLGCGDISVSDMERISKGLNKHELFVILSESDSRWAFEGKTSLRFINTKYKTSSMDFPGKEYISQYCMFILAKNKIFSTIFDGPKGALRNLNNVDFKKISRDLARKLIMGME